MPRIILVGNIGTGKTTVARGLQSELEGSVVLEERKGLFLQRFYSDRGYAFLNQLDYTLQFLEQHLIVERQYGGRWVIQDRSIHDTHGVFSQMLHAGGSISLEEFGLLSRLHALAAVSGESTLLVLLEARAELCYERMVARGDPEERLVGRDYLTALGAWYRQWFAEFEPFRKFVIDTEAVTPQEVVNRIIALVADPALREDG